MEQTCFDFEWLLIDDGSSDNSESLIAEYHQSAPFKIRYIKKENGGKHTALNVGFEEAKKEWIFVVDSDDWLKKDCIKQIIDRAFSISDNFNSISFLKQTENGDVIGDRFTNNLNTYLDRVYANILGDKADVFRKSSLKGYFYPEYLGENFMAESPIFLWLANKGNTCFFNYAGYICEYQSGGLSSMSVKNRYRCVKSTLYVYEMQYKLLAKFYLKSKAAVNWWRFNVNSEPDNDWQPPIIFILPGFFMRQLDIFKRRI
jgi:glycosyltransferase involved in cell wall biosynthesis